MAHPIPPPDGILVHYEFDDMPCSWTMPNRPIMVTAGGQITVPDLGAFCMMATEITADEFAGMVKRLRSDDEDA